MAIEISPKGKLILADVKKIGIGALLAGGGAALTYFFEALPNVNFGEFAPLVAAVCAIVLNIVRKIVSETKYK